MRKIRVLLVDDSVVIRRSVSDALAADPALEMAGTAAHGRIALAKIPDCCPDVIVLDQEMPEMDGLTTLAALRKVYPALPVIMFSGLGGDNAALILDALALGANDYVAKPSGKDSSSGACDELILKIKSLHNAATEKDTARTAAPRFNPTETQALRRPNVDIIAIAASTGGPNALAEILPALPADFPVPIVIVQHMPPVFTHLLAQRLTAKSKIRVQEGVPGAALTPGSAWLAPGDQHMTVSRDASGAVRLNLNQGPPENCCRPAADPLFRSVAEVYGPNSLGVVLTGMGQDGLRGSEALREVKSKIVVQDQASSTVWGMPGAVAKAGLADKILPLNQIADEIMRRTQRWPVPTPASISAVQPGIVK